jgi:hypothetical protein
MSMEISVLWDAAQCSLVDIDRRFRGTHHPNDRGSKIFWNVGQYLPDYTSQHPRRQPSSNQNQSTERYIMFAIFNTDTRFL